MIRFDSPLFLAALALQLITPLPYWPGMPLPRIGLIILAAFLFSRVDRDLKSYVNVLRLLLLTGLLVAAALIDDVLVRVGLCVICITFSYDERRWRINWFAGWWVYLLLFNLCAPVRVLVDWISGGLSYAAWLSAFWQARRTGPFRFGPDVAQTHFLILWTMLLLCSLGSAKVVRGQAVRTLATAVVIILVELNLIDSHYTDANIQLAGLFNLVFLSLVSGLVVEAEFLRRLVPHRALNKRLDGRHKRSGAAAT